MHDELIIIEREEVILVVWAKDPDDWIASFAKNPGFPAVLWAERMVALFNHGGKAGQR